MGVSRSVTGRDDRGNSYDRRARRVWLLSPEAGHGGNGRSVPCWECGRRVTAKTMHVDRIVPGEQGGRYTRDNIRPHCALCSHRQGQRRTAELLRTSGPGSALADPYDDTDHCRGCGRHYLAEHVIGCVWIGPWDDVSELVS